MQLDQKKDIELILLKGHLMLEVIIDDVINRCLGENKSIESLRLGFYKKCELLWLLSNNTSEQTELIKTYVLEINRLRNKLAHKFIFEEHETELVKWADDVLATLPEIKISRYTYRTKIVHAFANLSKCMYELIK
ncbi:MAG: hypothetical protein WC836_10750 [Desulfobacula sp.]